jgi:Fur family ferric uptake transcriptional regulator
MFDPQSQRNTRQRQVILDELRKVVTHPTAAGVYELVRRRLPGISLGTVYRNLDRLAELGLIQRIEWAGAQTRFDATTTAHDHVRCVRCGCVADLHGQPLELSPPKDQDLGGYKILGRRLEFLGLCPACQAAPAITDS